jgi:hypothetical protein
MYMLLVRPQDDKNPFQFPEDSKDQEKAVYSNDLIKTLFKTPVLVTYKELRNILRCVSEWGDDDDIVSVTQAMSYFLTRFPVPFWMIDLPYMS